MRTTPTVISIPAITAEADGISNILSPEHQVKGEYVIRVPVEQMLLIIYFLHYTFREVPACPGDWGEDAMSLERKKFQHASRYFVFAENELLFLIICVIMDISEYMIRILLLPTVGDFLDIAGIIASLVMFRWVGLISLVELVPGADILPIFIITWLVWYSIRKRQRTTRPEEVR